MRKFTHLMMLFGALALGIGLASADRFYTSWDWQHKYKGEKIMPDHLIN